VRLSFLSSFASLRAVLISFEGIDASGKNTQAKMLCDALAARSINFGYLSFPDYSTAIGQEIRNYLSLKREYSPETIHTLYAANRYEFKPRIDDWISEKRIIVLNRYCESNVAYGIADGLPRIWLEQLESRMPQADYIFYLRITPELSSRRKQSRDRFESSDRFLHRVSEVYDALALPPRWITVSGDREAGMVHYEILRSLSARFGEERKIFNVEFASNLPGSGTPGNPKI